MKMLHDDDVVGYTPPKTNGGHTVIEFQQDWLDEEGLPTRLPAWIRDNVQPDTILVGARILSALTVMPFYIQGPEKYKTNDGVSPHWRATFELANGNKMIVEPGTICIHDGKSHRLIRRYFEYLIEGGTTWKMDMELRLTRVRNYYDVPSMMGHAMAHIDSMVHSLTNVKHGNISTLLQMLGPGIQFQDRECARPTHPRVAEAYEYVAELYRALPFEKDPNERFFSCIKESCRRILLGHAPLQLLHRETPESEPTLVLPEGDVFHEL